MKKMYPKTKATMKPGRNTTRRFAASLFLICCAIGATAQNAKFEWVKNMGGPNWDWGQAVATDKDGNVFITGNYDGTADFSTATGTITITSAGSGDAFLAKYAPNGNCLWAKTLGGDMGEQGSMVAVDGKGNVYVTGNFYSTNFKAAGATTTYADAGNGDAFLVKYDGDGNYRWTRTMSGGDNETGYGLAVDDKYNIYISGNFGSSNMAVSGGTGTFASAGQGDIFIAKYDSAGNYRWAKTIGGADNDENRGIAIGHNGAIYLGGFINGTADMDAGTANVPLTALGVSDLFVAKYDSNFNYRWAKRIGSFSDDYGMSIALDSHENIYTTGCITGIATIDGTTTQLTPLGTRDVVIAK